jgi:hypothetical protein
MTARELVKLAEFRDQLARLLLDADYSLLSHEPSVLRVDVAECGWVELRTTPVLDSRGFPVARETLPVRGGASV